LLAQRQQEQLLERTKAYAVPTGIGTKSLNLNIFSISCSIWFKVNPVGAMSYRNASQGIASFNRLFFIQILLISGILKAKGD
jgi:hypothetical protein